MPEGRRQSGLEGKRSAREGVQGDTSPCRRQKKNFENSMQVEIFTIPVKHPQEAQEGLNRFLRSHRVLTVEKVFHASGEGCFWTFCVEYLEGTSNLPADKKKSVPKIDYKEVLSDEQFAVFSRLRDLRKSLAEREAVPAYAIFTNEQLAAMVRGKVQTMSELAKIEGLGESRVKKYGEAFLALLNSGNSDNPPNKAGEKP